MPNSSTNIYPYAFFQGSIVPSAAASINVASHGLQYGTSCFGGIRGFVGKDTFRIFRLHDHFTRLMTGIQLLGIPFSMDFVDFESAIVDTVKQNAPGSDFYIRPIVYSDSSCLVPLIHNLKYSIAIYMSSLPFDPSETGLNLMISSWLKYPDAALPTKAKASGTYLNSSLAHSQANVCGYDDSLLKDINGYIVEASASNVFVSYRDQLFTPPLGSAILDGITRRSVIALLHDEGLAVRQEPIDVSMIYGANEILLTGSATGIAFVQSVDQRELPWGKTMGPVCRMLRDRWQQLLEGRHAKSHEWLSEYPLS